MSMVEPTHGYNLMAGHTHNFTQTQLLNAQNCYVPNPLLQFPHPQWQQSPNAGWPAYGQGSDPRMAFLQKEIENLKTRHESGLTAILGEVMRIEECLRQTRKELEKAKQEIADMRRPAVPVVSDADVVKRAMKFSSNPLVDQVY